MTSFAKQHNNVAFSTSQKRRRKTPPRRPIWQSYSGKGLVPRRKTWPKRDQKSHRPDAARHPRDARSGKATAARASPRVVKRGRNVRPDPRTVPDWPKLCLRVPKHCRQPVPKRARRPGRCPSRSAGRWLVRCPSRSAGRRRCFSFFIARCPCSFTRRAARRCLAHREAGV